MAKVLDFQSLDDKLRLARADRFACQSVARIALPKERVSKCLRMVNGNVVEVWKHLKTEKAFYNGLLVCGSIWNCPVCAAKISERRRLELKQAYDTHIKEGGKVALLTLTFSHQKLDRLKDTLSKFGQAMQILFRGKRFDKVRKKLSLIGRIRAFEVTYGDNGWHPHTHIALFYTNDIDLKSIKLELFELWQKACGKVGLDTSQKYGLSLENGEKANEYLNKHGTWGLDQELTKAHIKKAKKESLTPFDLLRKYLESEKGMYLSLFKEYAEAFKGKKQLNWSPGLKKKFVIEDKTDEQLVKEKLEEADLLGTLTYAEWKVILEHDNRSKLLDYVERFGFETAIMLLIKKDIRMDAL